MSNSKDDNRPICRQAREGGSVYILVLGASLLIAAIGVSSLLAVRVQRREAIQQADGCQARELARSGLDLMMYYAKQDAGGTTWRTRLANKNFANVTFAGGDMTIQGVDPVDGNLTDDPDDPITLTCTANFRTSRYILEVTVDGEGTPRPGTWKRVVN